MERETLIRLLAAYRRPGTPSFERHFLGLPAEVVQADNVAALIDVMWDEGLPARIRDHAAGALGEIGDAVAIQPLLDALADRRVQRGAATALGRLRALEAAPLLRELASHVGAARWALSQLPAPDDTPRFLEELRDGHLRHIKPRLARLDAARAAAVAAAIRQQLREAVASQHLDGSHRWLITALQYLPPAAANASALVAAIPLIADEAGCDLSARVGLLRALAALRPLTAVEPLAAVLSHIGEPQHQHQAGLCLGKIVAAHGDRGKQLLLAHTDAITAAHQLLIHEVDTASPTVPDRPWDHRRGTPGWLVASRRALGTLEQLLEMTSPP